MWQRWPKAWLIVLLGAYLDEQHGVALETGNGHLRDSAVFQGGTVLVEGEVYAKDFWLAFNQIKRYFITCCSQINQALAKDERQHTQHLNCGAL